MVTLREEIELAVAELVKEWREDARQPEILLPITAARCKFDKEEKEQPPLERPEQFGEHIRGWLEEDSAEVMLVTAPLGGGKTMSTCQLPGLLGSSDGEASGRQGVVLWIPIRDLKISKKQHPTDAISLLLRRKRRFRNPLDLWGKAGGIGLIVIDGIDEPFASIQGREELIDWLNTFFQCVARAPCSPRVIISGRDVFLAPSVIDQQLDEMIRSICRMRRSGSSPERLSLKEWNDSELRAMLEEQLVHGGIGRDAARDLINLVARDVLSSPILYGHALYVLQKEAQRRPISTAWQLTERWIELIIDEDWRNHRGQTPTERRKYAAQEISLYLAASGIGGLSARKGDLVALENVGLRALAENPELLEDRAFELRHGCLLSVHDGKLRPFHAAILNHLAAEAMERLGHSEPFDRSVPYRFPTSIGTFIAELSQLLNTPHFAAIVAIIARSCTNDYLAQFDSVMRDVVRYWIAQRKWPASAHSLVAIQIPVISFNASLIKADPAIRKIYEVALIFRNSLLDVAAEREDLILGGFGLAVPAVLIYPADPRAALESLPVAFGPTGSRPLVVVGVERVSGTLLFLPKASMGEAREFAVSWVAGLPEKTRTHIIRARFCNYRIKELFVELPTSERFSCGGVLSIWTVGEVVSNVMRESNSGLSISLKNLVVWMQGPRSERIGLELFESLERYAVCDGDVLLVSLDGTDLPLVGGRRWELSGPGSTSALAQETIKAFESAGQEPTLDATMKYSFDLLGRLGSLPGGHFPVWSQTDNRNRRLEMIEVRPNIHLAEELVSVREYAAFLRENPHIRPPRQDAAGWSQAGGEVGFSEAAGNMPVTGITRHDAQAYLDWLTRAFVRSTGYTYALFRLPEPEWLQAAAQGSQLEEPLASGVGPFGHRDLTGRVWQWTSGTRGREALAFGGSEKLGDQREGSAQKTLLRAWPDLCRTLPPEGSFEDVGLRICVVDERDELLRIAASRDE
jgi:hypothetical protein